MLDDTVLSGIEVKRTIRGMIKADGMFAISISGIFAAGDAVLGPGLVGSAIRAGREAAVALWNAVPAWKAARAIFWKWETMGPSLPTLPSAGIADAAALPARQVPLRTVSR